MKNLYDIKYEFEKSAGKLDNEVMMGRKISKDLYVNRLMAHNRVPSTLPRTVYPFVVYILMIAMLMASILCFSGFFGVYAEWGEEEAFGNGIPLLAIGIVLAGLDLTLGISYIFRYHYLKTHLKLNDVNVPDEKAIEMHRSLLGVPKTSKGVDILIHPYRLDKDGKKVSYTVINKTPYYNIFVDAYVKNGKVCLTNFYFITEFDLRDVVRVEKLQERVSFVGWNKKVQPKDEKFRPVNLSWNISGDFSCAAARIIVRHEGEEYEILFPGYEEDSINSLLSGDNPMKSLNINVDKF